MSWLFSRALVEAYSAANSSAGGPSAPLNVTPTPRPFWLRDKPMESCPPSLYGLTLKPLTENRGACVKHCALLATALQGGRFLFSRRGRFFSFPHTYDKLLKLFDKVRRPTLFRAEKRVLGWP